VQATQQRKDIQGLRAIAVLLVVAGHLFPTVVQGGFIGVDIFFVISGFVITQQMLKNQLDSGKGFLVHFYARRIRRILPSALLVTAGTVWAAGYFLGPVVANNALLDAGWASVFLSNFHFQSTALDYFASGTQVSPLQHFWSLSIEEQFYLIWPAFFLLLFMRSISQRFRLITIGTITSLSLFIALYQSTLQSSPIFFSTSTRVWELGAGAMLAIAAKSVPIPRFVTALSLVLLLVCAFLIPQSMQWPRFTTLPIVILTLLLLLRDSRVSAMPILENKIATYVGDLSYIIYLWHWPVLVITKSYFANFGVQEILIVIGITAALSVITHHVYENPLRYSHRSVASPAMTLFIGVIAITACALTFFSRYQA
jgi:peptidoglycan/LPS O-acetylase OafA/YrhL